MATSNLTLSRVAYCERLEDLSLRQLLAVGQSGGLAPTTAETALGLTAGDIADQAIELATQGFISFTRTGTCSTNDAVTLELIARGVTCSAGFVRRIEVDSISVDDAGLCAFERRFVIEGGATPTIQVFGEAAAAETTMLKGSAGSEVAFDYTRTQPASSEAQTFGLAAGASTLTFTYTGQSGDVTNFRFRVKVFPKVALTFE